MSHTVTLGHCAVRAREVSHYKPAAKSSALREVTHQASSHRNADANSEYCRRAQSLRRRCKHRSSRCPKGARDGAAGQQLDAVRFCARELFAAGTQCPRRHHVRGQGATLARETGGSDKTSLSNMFHTFLATDAHDLLACPQSFQPG